MERTDPRYVTAEIDVFWSSDAFNDVTGTATAALINAVPDAHQDAARQGRHQRRRPARPTNSRSRLAARRGTGELDFRPIFAAAKDKVQYYHQEHDGGTITDADTSFTNLKGDRHRRSSRRSSACRRTSRPSPPARRRLTNAVAVTIKNTGDAPLTITAIATRQQHDRRRSDAGDFSIVSSTCVDATIAAACTERHPGRAERHLHRERRLQADDAPATARSPACVHLQRRRRDRVDPADGLEHQRRASAASAATSPSVAVADARRRRRASARSCPATARTYDTAVGRVGRQHRRRRDAVGHRPEHDRHGPPGQRHVLAAAAAAGPRDQRRQPDARRYAPLSETAGAPLTLLTLLRPDRGCGHRHDRLPSGDRRHRRSCAGSYSKTLTFTLSHHHAVVPRGPNHRGAPAGRGRRSRAISRAPMHKLFASSRSPLLLAGCGGDKQADADADADRHAASADAEHEDDLAGYSEGVKDYYGEIHDHRRATIRTPTSRPSTTSRRSPPRPGSASRSP